jgi:protein-S-isoprenylcysteine O-methyltransferase
MPSHSFVPNSYKIFRHPSYVGFYYWAVGTQLLLGNILHTVLFAIVACAFFRRRIPYEEEALMQIFPEEYPEYVKRTWIGIPFVPTATL